jgi:phasin
MVSHPFEIPVELRNVAQKNVDQARKAFEGFVEAAQTATKNFEGTADKLRADTRDINTKALGYAEENLRAAFDHAEKLVHARDSEEFIALQFEYARAQLALFQEQAKELSSIVRNAATTPKK